MTTVVGTPPGVTASGYRVTPPPTLPVTGAVVWLDASYAPSFTYSSGSVVSTWRDLSGNNRHFTQATASLQPARTGTQNGKATVVFDGTDDYMDTAAFMVPQPITIILAIDSPSSDVSQGWFSSVGGSLQTYVAGGTIQFYAGTSEVQGGANPGGAHQWRFTANAASSTIHLDGASFLTGRNPGTAGTTTGFRLSERGLAGGYRLTGALFEAIAYDRVLNSTEITAIETYIRSKWGTP